MEFIGGTSIDDFILSEREKLQSDRKLRAESNMVNIENLDSPFPSLETSDLYCKNLTPVGHELQRTQHKQDKQHIGLFTSGPEPRLKTMVRYGEYSPLNPTFLSPGKFLLELGEYEEKRRLLIHQKKLEYKEYLSQARLTMKSKGSSPTSPQIVLQNNEEIATNTAISGQEDFEIVNKPILPAECSISPRNQNMIPATPDALDNCSSQSPQPPAIQNEQTLIIDNLSPRERKMADLQASEPLSYNYFDGGCAGTSSPSIPPFKEENQSEIYKNELRQQIEEKRRLEIELKEIERKEDEAINRRVAEQQEKIRLEYLAEESKKLETQKQKLEELEKFRLQQEQLQKTKSSHEVLTQQINLPKERHPDVLQERGAISELNTIPSNIGRMPSNILNSPLNDDLSQFTTVETVNLTTNHVQQQQISLQPSSMVGFKTPSFTVIDPPTFPNNIELKSSRPSTLSIESCKTCNWDKHKNNHAPTGNFDDSLPIPVFRAKSPVPIRRSPTKQHCIPNNIPVNSQAMQILDAKWQVPAVEKNSIKTYPTGSRPKNVLTQLGAFRRQLQEEQIQLEGELQVFKPRRSSKK